MTTRTVIPFMIVGLTLGILLPQKKGPPRMFKPAEKKPHVLEIHGDKRVDNYFWMRERDSQPVLDYLKMENERTAEGLKPVAELEKKLYWELRSRIKENDASVPIFDDGYYYYTRYNQGQEYPIHCRKKGSLDATEDIILDENVEAKGHTYFDVSGAQVSPDHMLLGFAVDTVGRRINTIRFKDLRTGKYLPDEIKDVTPNFVWAADNKTIFFTKQDAETLRSFQVYRYELGSGAGPELIFEEKDETYDVGLTDSRNGEKLFLVSEKRGDSAEWSWLDAHTPRGQWQMFLKREKDHEYSLEDGGDRVYILTNWQAKNFRLMEAPYAAKAKTEWKEVIAHDPKTLLEGVDVYKSHLIVNERENALSRLRVLDRVSGKQRQVAFSDPVYEVEVAPLADYESNHLRFNYESPVQQPAVYDEEFVSEKRTLRKEREVPGYDKKKYEARRIWAKAKDGVEIPIVILMKKGMPLNGQAPILVHGYGSYGLNTTADFSGSMISLVDRGFVYARPQIRGGSEMGRHWYDTGKMKHKMNTFTDFIAATEKLVADGYAAKDRVHMMGGSAGGLLMGAVMNLRPDLYKGVIAAVPFVDVLSTMLDDSIPLTTGEYNEWGNPNIKEQYGWMREYSPYDNVASKAYPNLFVTTGYHDSQVQYWEPAKWVAKLRELKTDNNLLLFYTELKAGHSGASGRFEALKMLAKEFAFILMLEGIKE